ncbi:Polyadenylate-binding protein 2 [Platanthera guangdongensis]|uniref:Polyadenylate-binding protein 2 n=1 Tax=Platanthera guangdongensis TaxID=2320717 RepID=A0ABR2LNX6_9ASPA
MAVVDNSGGSDLGTGAVSSSSRDLDLGSGTALEHENLRAAAGMPQKSHLREAEIAGPVLRPHRDSSFSGFDINDFQPQQQWVRQGVVTQLPNGGQGRNEEDGFQRDMMDLQELLSKLNPMAEEFVPQSQANHGSMVFGGVGIGSGLYSNGFVLPSVYHNAGYTNVNGNGVKQRKIGHSQGRRRMNSRTSMAQQEEIIRRTVYVSDIDQQVTEEELAALFVNCGQVVDCRVCGDPNSVLRFAFVEFTDEEGANASLSLSGTMLGYYPVRVLPSKTAIAPVDPKYLPRSEDEREMCTRTIYCTNIDNKVNQSELKLFFERVCGPVFRLRVLGDYHHATRIAFIEFARAESAIAALNCSGAILGSLPLRVSPSKTPVRPRATRAPM